LTARLIAAGAAVWAVDFSAEMLVRARVKAPAAVFAQAGLMDDYPPEFRRPFDRVVSTYTFHELPLADKVTLLRRLAGEYLHPNGYIVLGDIGFPNAAARDAIKQRAGDAWDDEFYWLLDEISIALHEMKLVLHWHQISSCGVVISLEPESI
jgi:putative AdoMet-dependent methyltransferase